MTQPTPAGVDHVVLRGTLSGGEKFATGFWRATQGPTTNAQASLVALTGTGTWTAFLNSARAILNTVSAYTAVDLYQYVTAGPATDRGTVAISGGAGTGGTNFPNQCACVMTMRSANLTRSGRGRMYLPANGASMGSAGLYDATKTNAIVTALAGLLTSNDGKIVSKTRGAVYDVTSVDADYIPDTIRARNDALVSSRFSAAVS